LCIGRLHQFDFQGETDSLQAVRWSPAEATDWSNKRFKERLSEYKRMNAILAEVWRTYV